MLARLLAPPQAAAPYPADHDFWYAPVGGASLTGLRVGAREALSASPVWGAVRLLAESVATLPLVTYQRLTDGGKQRAEEHPLYELLHQQPNALQTAFAWKRMMMVHALLWGNAYSLILPGPRGPVDSLWPLHPDGVRVKTDQQGGLIYLVRQPTGGEKAYSDADVFHLSGLSLDGVAGLSVMDLARESIAVNLAAKQYTSRFFGQGARPAGVLKHPGRLSPEAIRNLRESWQEIHGGLGGMQRPAILQEGMDWAATGIDPDDAALLGVLEWSAADVARFFNVPLHMIQETSKVTSWGTGIEALSLGYVTYSLLPWLTNWQQTISKDLILARRIYFAEFIVDALLRGDTKGRFEAYQIAAGGNAPWMTRNEIRERENMNPLPGLDEPLQPLNMGQVGQTAGAPSQEPQAYLELLTREAAARVVRKEVAAMARLDQRCSDDRAAFLAEAAEFYGAHERWVAQVLHISPASARAYTESQLMTLADEGIAAVDTWEPAAVDRLTDMALNERGAGYAARHEEVE